MIAPTIEEILQAARMLPPQDQRLLRRLLAEDVDDASEAAKNGEVTFPPEKNYEGEYNWLREHRAEYAGQWVALNGDKLVSHGPDVRQVHAIAQAAGIEFPYLVQIEAEDSLPFGGW